MRLTADEVTALASAFCDEEAARQLLDRAGIARGRQPGWGSRSALVFWLEVARLVENGVAIDCRRSLLEAASAWFPGNPVFGDRVPASETTRAVRLRPSVGSLPGLPARFVDRDGDVAAVRNLLTKALGQVVGIVGMGGAGKSTLARAVVHDPAVREAFPDGVVWVEVNPHPDLTAVVSRVLRAFGDRAPVLDVDDGSERLRHLLDGAACLVVLDDVWQVDVLRALPVTDGSRLLVTTRSRDALFTDSDVHALGLVRASLARRLLASYAGRTVAELPVEAEMVAHRCGGLVLALAVAGGMVAEGRPWSKVAELLGRADRTRLSGRFADYPHPNLLAALDVSVSTLDTESINRFRELAVFGSGEPVPSTVAVLLWQTTAGLDDLAADEVLRMLGRRSLVQLDPDDDTFMVHDLLLDYARSGLTDGRLAKIHMMLCHAFLDRWGGLDEALPVLRTVAGLTSTDFYGVRRLVAHLIDADRADVLDTLLRMEWPTGSEKADNVWFTVHENLGTTAACLADLRAALVHAQRGDCDSPGGDAISRMIHYALVLGSVASMAGNVPSALLVRAVEEQLWEPRRALAYAHTIPAATARAEALVALAPHLNADERGEVLAQAMVAMTAAAASEAFHLAPVVARLVRRLPADSIPAAVAAVKAIVAPLHRSEALIAFAPRLPRDGRQPIIEEALTAAAEAGGLRARALARVAPHLPAERQGRVLAQALASATAVDDPRFRAEALAELAPHLTPDLVLEAVAVVDRLEDDLSRALAWAGLAPHLPDGTPGPTLAEALNAWAVFDAPPFHARALAWLAPYLPPDLLACALKTAIGFDQPYAASHSLAGLVPYLPLDRLGDALDAVVAIDHQLQRAQALADVAPYLPPEMLPVAMDAAAALEDPFERTLALQGISPYLPADLLPAALAAAVRIGSPSSRADELTALAPYLPPERRDAVRAEARSHALAIQDPRKRAYRLAALAPSLPGHILSDALSLALSEWPLFRERALASLAAHLPDHLIRRGFTHTMALDDAHERDIQLSHLATCLPADLIPKAVARATAIRNRARRLRVLADLGQPPADQALRQALAEAAADDVYLRSQMLADLAPLLPTDMLGDALDVATAPADNESWRAYGLVQLIPHLPNELLAMALDAALAIDDEPGRVATLEALVPHLPTDRLVDVLAARIKDPGSRARILVAMSARDEGVGGQTSTAIRHEALRAAARTGRSSVVTCVLVLLGHTADAALAMQMEDSLKATARCWP